MILALLVLLGVALVTAELLMLICWGIYLFQRRFSIVDIGWAMAFFVLTLIFFIVGEGYFWRKMLLLIIVSLWSLRLAVHLVKRYFRQGEDPRYPRMVKIWFANRNPFFQAFLLFTCQGAIVTILSLPFLLICQNPLPCFEAAEMFGLFIVVGGIAGESVADWQLVQFKRRTVAQTECCEEGVWRYSRHPNYFFEWVIWLGFFLMALPAPFGWLSIVSPALILYLLLKVSGIPPSEELAVERKGEAYLNYQSRVSPFFPWFRRNRKHEAPFNPSQEE